MKQRFALSSFFKSEQIINDGSFYQTASCGGHEFSGILCYAVNEKYLQIAAENPKVTAIIVPDTLKDFVNTDKGLVISTDAELDYTRVNNQIFSEGKCRMNADFGIHSSAVIDPTSWVHPDVFIGKNVKIGRGCIINQNTIIGDDCIIGNNVTIGNEGLYFKRNKESELYRIESTGAVVIDEKVEILDGSMVQKSHDMGAYTRIGKGSKISVNVNVAHGVVVGAHTLISGNVQIAGRAKIGSYCWIGTSSTISDSVTVGDRSQIRIGSVVIQDVSSDGDVSGNYAYAHRKNLKEFIGKVRG